MATNMRIGPLLYGFLFAVMIPALLVIWAVSARPFVFLPSITDPTLGIALAAVGAVLVVSGMAGLWTYGKGLPMNAYPPPLYVSKGVYRLHRHPIYLGFCMIIAGISVWSGSACGLWLVTPVVMLSCTALVLGYENIDLRDRFGAGLARPLFHLPDDRDDVPGMPDRLSIYFLVLLPWLILYEWLAALGAPPDAIEGYMSWERNLPVIEWTELLYASTYLFVIFVPIVAPTKRVLREFAIQGIVGTALMALVFIAIPIVATPRPFEATTFAGRLLMWERSLDTPANAFPSYHVLWILLAMQVFGTRMPRLRFAWWTFGGAIALSCVTTGMHSILDVTAGFVLFLVVRRPLTAWEFLRRSAEKIANSWKEWRFGSVRVINHGLYAGIGSLLAVGIAGSLAGPANLASVMLVAFSALVVSGLWAQIVEGSPSLLRPYGYYGGVLGIVLGALLAWLILGTDPWLLLAAYSVAGPWVQSFGRLRCLVQGCCHGRRAPQALGIVYTHPRSRVCRLSDLRGVPVHPTPLYSILWNIVIAVIVSRLWSVHASLTMIGGLYLILTGVGRFVEEAYRGEPQTRMYSGLRLYQWIAIFTVCAGAVMTCINSSAAAGHAILSVEGVVLAIVFGGVTWFALGVDFPSSNRRFARLA